MERYVCHNMGNNLITCDQISWDTIESMELKEVVNGEKPRLTTSAKACWTDEALFIRFYCEDDHVLATMRNRDDPLYNEDVVEVFIDEQGTGRKYIELEISPRNVIFDAIIENEGTGRIKLDLEWDADGLQTDVTDQGAEKLFDIVLPFSNVDKKPEHGTEWRWNLYRIDYDPEGKPHYWAWSPTGAIDFHITRHFGVLSFSR